MSIRNITLTQKQTDGVAFLTSRNNALLADEAGLGKTIQALAAISNTPDIQTWILVVPPSAVPVWTLHIEEYTDLNYIVQRRDKQSNAIDLRRSLNIISSGLLTKQLKFIFPNDNKPFGLVCDEAHYFKNETAARTQVVYALAKKASITWMMSATPMKNSAQDLSLLCTRLFSQGFADLGGKHNFLRRFCQLQTTPFGSKWTGIKNHKDLMARLRPYMLRRLLSVKDGELPHLRISRLPVKTKATQRTGHASTTKEFADVEDDKLLDALNQQKTAIASVRKTLGLSKVDGVSAYVKDQMEGSEHKLVLFCYHTDVIDLLSMQFALLEWDHVILDGRTSKKDRAEVVKRFQTDENVRVFIGQIEAAGTAITLTAAHIVILVEPSWTVADNTQAIKRIHRFGQKKDCLAYFAYSEHPLDKRIAKVLSDKQDALVRAGLDDASEFEASPSAPRSPVPQSLTVMKPVTEREARMAQIRAAIVKAMRPSNASVWTKCSAALPLSVNLKLAAPDTHYANAGSYRHEIAAKLLSTGQCPDDGSEDFAAAYAMAFEYAAAVKRAAKNASKIAVEKSVSLAAYGLDKTGTVDAAFVVDQRLNIWDFKAGEGQEVAAVNNTQLLMYAGAILDAPEKIAQVPNGVRIVIYQPTFENSMKVWDLTSAEFTEAIDKLKQAQKRVFDPRNWLSPTPGKHCIFCDSKVLCPAYTMALTFLDNDSLTLDKNDADAMGFMLHVAQKAEKWGKATKATVLAQYPDGAPTGFKRVAGKNERVWRSEPDTREALEAAGLGPDDLYTMKLISPSQVEKLLGKKRYADEIADLVDTRPQGTRVVADPDVTFSADGALPSMFMDLSGLGLPQEESKE